MRAQKYNGPDITVQFEDQGQDFLEWDIQDGVVVGCRPFQASVWCGVEIFGTPYLGGRVSFKRTNESDDQRRFIKYSLVSILPLKVQVSA